MISNIQNVEAALAPSWPTARIVPMRTNLVRPRSRLTARVNPTIHGAMLRIGHAGDGGGGYSRVDPGGQPWGIGRGPRCSPA